MPAPACDGNPVSHVNLYVMPQEAGSAAALHDVLRRAEVEKGWSDWCWHAIWRRMEPRIPS